MHPLLYMRKYYVVTLSDMGCFDRHLLDKIIVTPEKKQTRTAFRRLGCLRTRV